MNNRVLFYLLTVFFLSFCISCQKTKNKSGQPKSAFLNEIPLTWEDAGLQGQVKTLTVYELGADNTKKTYYFDSEGRLVNIVELTSSCGDSITVRFDTTGRLIDTLFHLAGFGCYQILDGPNCLYREDGLPLELAYRINDSLIDHYVIYTYDSLGRLVESVYCDADKVGLGMSTQYDYDSVGNLIEERYYSDGLAEKHNYEYDQSKHLVKETTNAGYDDFGLPGMVWITLYDSLGRKTEQQYGLNVAYILEKTEFCYDNDGRLVSERLVTETPEGDWVQNLIDSTVFFEDGSARRWHHETIEKETVTEADFNPMGNLTSYHFQSEDEPELWLDCSYSEDGYTLTSMHFVFERDSVQIENAYSFPVYDSKGNPVLWAFATPKEMPMGSFIETSGDKNEPQKPLDSIMVELKQRINAAFPSRLIKVAKYTYY